MNPEGLLASLVSIHTHEKQCMPFLIWPWWM